MNALVQDLHFGCRRLRRHPLATATAIMTLALGIGACTAIFSVVDAVLIRPLPYTDAEQLVALWETHPRQAAGYRVASLPAAETWRDELGELAELAVTRPWRPVLSHDEDLLSLEGAKVSAGFFALLGIEPIIGRPFTATDEQPDAIPVVLISYRLWQKRFGGDHHLVGSQILLEGAPERILATVVGVLPPDVRIDHPVVHGAAKIFAPLTDQTTSDQFGKRYFRVIGRLADGARIEAARSHLATIASRLSEARPVTNAEWGAAIDRLHEQLAAPIRPALLALVTGVGLVFLVACCNVGILMMSQASARRRELALCLALGARAWRVGRQILTECLLLSFAGGAVGLWLAHQGLILMTAYIETLPSCGDVAIDRRAFIFALGLVLSTVLLLGMAPAFRVAGLDLRSSLAALGKQRRPTSNTPRYVLVAAELALSSMLLVAASMLITSFQRLATADPGFEPRGATAMRLRAVAPTGHGTTRPRQTYRQLLDEAAGIPGVRAAGLVNQPPLSGSGMSSHVAPSRRPEELLRVEFRGVTSQYFEALGIPIIKQQGLERLDRDEDEPSVVVVSQAAAHRLWPGTDAVGQRLVLAWGDEVAREVVGVVGDVRHPTAPADVQPTVYIPFRQAPHRAMTLILRDDERNDLFAIVRARARSLGSPLVVDRPRDLEQEVARAIAEPRARALLLAAFALTAVLLAAGGTYSVVALVVEQRRYDSSVRLALGAHPRRLVRETMTEMLRPASLGIALGLGGSLLLTRTLSDLLYGIGLQDPGALISTAAFMTLVVGVATYLPAHRQSNANPATALRTE